MAGEIDQLYTSVMEAIHKAAKESIPLKGNIILRNKVGNIWWNNDCALAGQQKIAAYKRYLKNRTSENHILAKEANNKVNRIIIQAKKDYWNAFCND